MMKNTNIENLPENHEYFTGGPGTDAHPYVVIKSTPKSRTLVPVNVEKHPEWKPHFIPGGFAGHCTNQHEQKWVFKDFGTHRVIVRLDKRGRWKNNGTVYRKDVCVKFYDYNF